MFPTLAIVRHSAKAGIRAAGCKSCEAKALSIWAFWVVYWRLSLVSCISIGCHTGRLLDLEVAAGRPTIAFGTDLCLELAGSNQRKESQSSLGDRSGP